MQTNQLLKKYSFLICLVALQLLPGNVFSKSSDGDSVVIWSEDFTGYDADKFPSQGKTAVYRHTRSYGSTTEPSVAYSSVAGSPHLNLYMEHSGGLSFNVYIPLYHAAGDFSLTFSSDHPEDLVVTSLNNTKKVVKVVINKIANSSSRYSISIPSELDTLRLSFLNTGSRGKNVDLDDILLLAPSDCRPTKPLHNISYPKDTISVIWGECFEPQTLENAEGLPISYWSYDKRVASVDSEGKIAIHSLGYTTISAIFKGDDDYGYEEASYVLHIDRRVPDDEVFFEDFNKCISEGGRDGSMPFNYTGKAVCDNPHSSGGNMAYKCIAVEESKNKYTISSLDEIDGHDGILSFLARAKKNNAMGSVSLTNGGTLAKTDFEANKSDWTLVTIPFKDATANSVFTLSGDNIYIDSVSVQAYPKSIQLNVGKTGYASMYYGTHSLIVPNGATAYTMKVVGNTIDDSHRYAAGDVIPKGTGVIVKAKEGNYDFYVTTDNGYDDSADNQLRGSDYEQMTTGGDIYYMLAAPGGRPIGYYWAARKGGAFLNGAHKAYLVLTKNVSAKSGYGFNINDTTAIKLVSMGNNASQEERYFNVMGQRINEHNYKGVILKNGKKFIKR